MRSGAVAARLEAEHVQRVYDEIACHFSTTRYKAWPVVDRFVKGLATGAIGVDVGCGNGKNMMIRPDREIWITGFDLYLFCSVAAVFIWQVNRVVAHLFGEWFGGCSGNDALPALSLPVPCKPAHSKPLSP